MHRAASSGRQRSKRDSNRSDLAERALRDQPPQGEVVGVPAAVLEDGQQQPARVGVLDERPRLRRGRRERLVDDHRQPGVERARASGAWASFAVAITTKSCSSARLPELVGVATTLRARVARGAPARGGPGSRVTTVATARPSVAAISGAWKIEPASP